VGVGSAPNSGYQLTVTGNAGITNNNVLEFGVGVPGKETHAGKIGYQTFSPYDSLDIVGAGPTAYNRKIKMWDNTNVMGWLNVSGYLSASYTYGYLSSTNTGTASGTSQYSITCNKRIAAEEFNAFCDRRAKEEIDDISDDVCSVAVSKLRPRFYRLKNYDGSKGMYRLGFIAQEVLDAVPQAVSKMPRDGIDDYHTLDHSQITAVNTGAIKSLQARIQSLETMVQSMLKTHSIVAST
jgi:hypothetical protein